MEIEYNKDGMFALATVLLLAATYCSFRVVYRPTKNWAFFAAFGGVFLLCALLALVKWTAL